MEDLKILKPKRSRLQTRFFLAYLLLVLILAAGFSIFFYQYASKILVRQETESLIDTTSSFLDNTEHVIKDIDTVSINIGYSNLVKNKLGTSFELNLKNDDFRSLADLFVSINGVDSKVDQINLYDFEGNVLQVGLNTRKNQIRISDLDWMEPAKERKGGKYLSLPYENYFWTNNRPGWFISLYRTYYNQYGQEVGFIETSKQCKSIFKNIITYKKKNDDAPGVYVYDANGTLLYPYDLDEQESPFHYFTVCNTDDGHVLWNNTKTNQKEVVVYQTSKYTGWTYVTVQKQDLILRPVNHLLRILVIVAGIMLLASVIISYSLSKALTRPIKQLRNIIRKTELDTLGMAQSETLTTSIDELAELNSSFQKMSRNLKISMEELLETKQQELKSRSLALQSQINPHFYYNTLASIIVLAENNQPEEVVSMCRNLTSIMRYITKADSPTVTLGEEIDYVGKYLYCMKVRYQTSLTYEINIDESLLELQVPKLIIQPSVENALKYGTNVLPPWHITIQSRIEPDGWYIDVMDTGPGFSKEAMNTIQERMKNSSVKGKIPDIGIDGMGMLNIYLRWSLFGGKDAVFSFQNSKNGHAIVTIGHKKTQEEDLTNFDEK